jgi:hypothetical protein
LVVVSMLFSVISFLSLSLSFSLFQPFLAPSHTSHHTHTTLHILSTISHIYRPKHWPGVQ